MTRTDIRKGIATYFGGSTFDTDRQIYRPTPLQVQGLAGVRAYIPEQVTTADRYATLPTGTLMGAVMGVWLGESTETRLTIGGTLSRPYSVELWLWHVAAGPRTEAAQQHVDDLVEAVVARVRADPTLGMPPGNPGPVVLTQAGEGETGIRTAPGMPYTEPGASPKTIQDVVIAFQAATYPNIA